MIGTEDSPELGEGSCERPPVVIERGNLVITAKGHLGGDPFKNCGDLGLSSKNWQTVQGLAAILRVLAKSPANYDRMVATADQIEAEERAAADPALS
jgi:hypothetical protein